MNNRKPCFLSLCVWMVFILIAFQNFAFSQSIQRYSFASANQNSSASGYSLQSSIGDLMVLTNVTSTTTITQGFIQNEQPGVIVTVPNAFDFSFKVFPNPVYDYLNVELITNEIINDLRLEVYDMLGNIQAVEVDLKQIQGKQLISLKFSNQKQGLYFLKVYSAQQNLIQTFKITKI